MKLTQRQIDYLNTPKNIRDDGKLVRTGQPPEDWYRAAQRAGSDHE
jgi:hypothetical protein